MNVVLSSDSLDLYAAPARDRKQRRQESDIKVSLNEKQAIRLDNWSALPDSGWDQRFVVIQC